MIYDGFVIIDVNEIYGSWEGEFEDLVLNYFEIIATRTSSYHRPGDLVIDKTITVVAVWKVAIAALIQVAIISQMNVMTTSESWPVSTSAIYRIPCIY